jgi:hypothetical protein
MPPFFPRNAEREPLLQPTTTTTTEEEAVAPEDEGPRTNYDICQTTFIVTTITLGLTIIFVYITFHVKRPLF